LLFLSLLPPVQSLLLEPRIWLQAVYRHVTVQVPAKAKSPVRVIQIDEESIKADTYRSEQVNPIDYSYLAALLNRLSQLNAKVVGIDYVLDDKNQPNNSLKLKQSVSDAVGRGAWFVFASGEGEHTRRAGVSKTIASLNWSLEGDISFLPWYVQLSPIDTKASEIYPFGYLLAVAYRLNQELPPNLPTPNLVSQTRFNASVINYLNQGKPPNQTMAFLEQARFHSLTNWSQKFLQHWLSPILDFSLQPDVAYERISACKLLGDCQGKGTVPNDLKNDVVVIIPGGYKGAGLEEKNDDNFTVPMAIGFWRGWEEENFPGGEAHAYMLHHLLTQRLVVPIPDLWMILLAAFLGKGMTLVLQDNPRQQRQWILRLGVATTVYMIASLQIYISAAVLFPWFLPSVVFWNFIRLALRRRFYGSV
jgi:CHASE2 domain-containing sensor protein